MVCFVTNSGYIDSNAAAGLRLALAEEFSSLYVFNLRGNSRNSGEAGKREAGNVFNVRVGAAIMVLVKNPDATRHGLLHYRDIGDYLTREQKLSLIAEYGSIDGVPWEPLIPNESGDWLNQRDDTFGTFTSIGDKAAPGRAVFKTHSAGLQTNRDAWVYSSSRVLVERNVKRMISVYNAEVDRWEASDHSKSIEDFVDTDATRISWARSLRAALKKGTRLEFDPSLTTSSVYRPFNKQNVYFAPLLNHERGQMPRMFPTAEQDNLGFYYVGMGSAVPFSVLMIDSLPDLHVTGAGSGGQFFPRYTYEARGGDTELDIFGDSDPFTRVDNVTDEILAEYQRLYGVEVTKDDVFFFIYGLLHASDYREIYAADLKKMLPRIPKLADASDFVSFVEAGRKLSALHLDYEAVEPYPLEMVVSASRPSQVPDLRVAKMRFAGKAGAWDKSTIRFNDEITLTGIPDAAHEYLLGSRSAIEWIIERYRVKTDKDSGIVNDPNDWAAEHDDPEYILNLLKRIVTVSVGTVKIVSSLPSLKRLAEIEEGSENAMDTYRKGVE